MRYKAICKYDGKNYKGFQIQKDLPTIEKAIESVLYKILKTETKIYASGRTDAGVHALGQVFHFDAVSAITPDVLLRVINSLLPKDIYLESLEQVSSDFHARYSAVKKEYHYVINTAVYDPFKADYEYYYPYGDIDHQKLKRAFDVYLGKHDYISFSTTDSSKDTVREIYEVKVEENDGKITVKVIGNGFLRTMVRIFVAMALEVARDKISVAQLQTILDLKDKSFPKKVAPAQGLYLYRVYY